MLSSYPLSEYQCVEGTREPAETGQWRKAKVIKLRGIFVLQDTTSQIKGDPPFRQKKNDLFLKLTLLQTPEKAFLKQLWHSLCCTYNRYWYNFIGRSIVCWEFSVTYSDLLIYRKVVQRRMHLWQPLKILKRYVMHQSGLLWCGRKRCWWLRTRWFPPNWALTQHFNNWMKNCILAEVESPQIAISKVFINLILHQTKCLLQMLICWVVSCHPNLVF